LHLGRISRIVLLVDARHVAPPRLCKDSINPGDTRSMPDQGEVDSKDSAKTLLFTVLKS
jgi:hypothetical protein